MDFALALGLLPLVGVKAAYSFGVGAIVWLVPNVYFIYKFFDAKKAKVAKQLVWVFYRAEVFKLLFGAIFFVLAIKWFAVLPLFVLGAYILAQVLFLIMIWFSFLG